MNHSPWLVTRPRERRPFRLYCFSYAGGSASAYMPWQSLIDPSVQICGVQLPGREGRMEELPWTSMTAIVKAIADVISVQDPAPFALFGHSLGGFIAFEVARELRRRQACAPSHLFLSGCVAPQCLTSSRLHELSDNDLIDALREYNGTPEEILGNRPLMAFLLPTIRADSVLFAGYRFEAGPPLDMSMSIFAGKADPRVPVASAKAWSAHVCGDVDLCVFDGDHFFIRSESVKVVNRISETLRACCVR
ncbi:thioesterase II family protein [Massilia scottii]|uniref:thioesterase II family protein n=1 Tax=Massilia scottii TaxID=3057166 RepID=UPI00279687D9|nr:alpha/beta fold hydrolase [Massilia sp. CCM 9029]MDQ1835474.1 alpha/beta fold hydrolase [Massilia sp. CCM 9029]